MKIGSTNQTFLPPEIVPYNVSTPCVLIQYRVDSLWSKATDVQIPTSVYTSLARIASCYPPDEGRFRNFALFAIDGIENSCLPMIELLEGKLY